MTDKNKQTNKQTEMKKSTNKNTHNAYQLLDLWDSREKGDTQITSQQMTETNKQQQQTRGRWKKHKPKTVQTPTYSWRFEIHVNKREINDEAQNEDKQSEGATSTGIADKWRQQEVHTGQQHNHRHHDRNLDRQKESGQARYV